MISYKYADYVLHFGFKMMIFFKKSKEFLKRNSHLVFPHQDAKIWHKKNIECNMWMHVVQLYTCMETHDKGKNSRLIWGYVKDFIIEYNAYF
jgi:hypothetical protein